ncbi:MAG: carboxymuconolactone decarboxylase family protein [Sedimentibacter sp.]|uniref:carboxymuconolactone decarboxylase family protein n=1 Tax=Sedimentibacter sp. TaxID=1960295 RepID=UPI0029812276|nr:carboxymuconolactone decarboxylase family protein [Sedimentibacter sp.]MDW5300292.1 carboxymuconolactone decarboxylase family protein [Sedimentibacter sp.]
MKIDVGRKLYSIKEMYTLVYHGIRTVPYTSKAKRNNELGSEFIERIMLAVTEVNGCEICSYAHTKMALEAGMSNEEIQNMLSGVMANIPSDEIQAIMFAQHYADSRGKPARETWNRIVESYGLNKSYGILGAIRIIMMGNAYGIPWSSFANRLKGRPDRRSSLLYEVEVIIIGSVLIPFAIVHSLIASLLKLKIIDFKS